MRKSFFAGMFGILLTLPHPSAATEESAEAFFKAGLKREASARLEKALAHELSKRLYNVEVSITEIDPHALEFSIITVQPFLDDMEAGRAGFVQASLFAFDHRKTLNLGLGYRALLSDNMVIAGLNVFYDHELEQEHQRAGVGGEILTGVGDMRFNYYHAISSERTGPDDAKERALDGWDAELALPCLLYTSPSPRDATLSRMPSSA